jgi:hypothetical protein
LKLIPKNKLKYIMASMIQYIKSTHWKDEYENDPVSIREKRGYNLLVDGHLFYNHRINKNTIYWICINYKSKSCKSFCTIYFDGRVKNYPGVHSDQPLDPIEIDVYRFKNIVKERISREETNPSTIYAQERRKMSQTTETSLLAKHLPSYYRVSNALLKRRSRNRPKLPTSIKGTNHYLYNLNPI